MKKNFIKKHFYLLSFFIFIFQIFLIYVIILTKKNKNLKTKDIYIFNKNISAGETPSYNDLNKITLSQDEINDLFANHIDLENFEEKVYFTEYKKGQVLMASHIKNQRSYTSFLDQIPPGKRLYVLRTNFAHLASMIKVGNRVDIVANMDLPEIGNTSEIILENITVQMIGNNFQNHNEEENKFDSLSFFLSMEEIKFISYLENSATFSVILRNPMDYDKNKEHQAMTLNKFLANPKIQKAIENDWFKIKRGKSN